MKVCSFVEAALIQWMEDGLYSHTFTVQLDNRMGRKTLLVCVPGKRIDLKTGEDSIIHQLSAHRMSYVTYYTGGINVFACELEV